MKLNKSLGIRNKLIAAFIVVVLIPLVMVSYFLDFNVKKQTEHDFVEATTREVIQVDKAINIFFEGLMSNTKMLAAQPLTKQSGGKVSVYIDKKAGPDGMIPMTPIENGGYESELYRMFELFGATLKLAKDMLNFNWHNDCGDRVKWFFIGFPSREARVVSCLFL